MQLVLSKDEINKIVRLCLTGINLENVSTFGIVIDYPTKEYSFVKEGMYDASQVDILMKMLETGKRVYFVDNGEEYDLTLKLAEERLKLPEAIGVCWNILRDDFTEEDLIEALQYIIYGRYKYPCL
jgi:hypothetical protein